MMNDVGTLAVFAFALILLTVLISRMNGETIALLGTLTLLFFMCNKRFRTPFSRSDNDSANVSGMDGSEQESPAGHNVIEHEPNVMTSPTGDPAVWASINEDQRPKEPEFGAPNDSKFAQIKKSNQLAVREIFGRRYGGTMDNALYKHKQRIGDRDRQATINQIRARRNNVYEPYYRQELSEAERSGAWWNNDDILTTKLAHHQLSTIDMGRFNQPDSDLDGIYS